MTSNQPSLFENPRTVQRILRVFYTLCAAIVLLDLVYHRHVLHPWEHLIGFYALFGFIACVVLVLVAKAMRKFLMRDEHYYDR